MQDPLTFVSALTPYRDALATLRQLGDAVSAHEDRLASSISRASLLPRKFTTFDVAALADIFHNYGDLLAMIHEGRVPHPVWQHRGPLDITTRIPAGPIAAVLPYNGPAMTFGLAFAAAFVLGQRMAIKPASESHPFFDALEDVFAEAGLESCLSNDDGSPVIQRLDGRTFFAEHLRSDSPTRVFQYYGHDKVVDNAVRAAVRKKLVPFRFILEGPGKNRFIVTDDLPEERYDETARIIAQLGTINGGQTCMGAEIFDIHEDLAPRLIPLVVRHVAQLRVGDPLCPETDIPPFRDKMATTIYEQVEEALLEGAKLEYASPTTTENLVLARSAGSSHGADFPRPRFDASHTWVPAFVLSGTTDEMRIRNEETFGPVIAIGTYRTDTELITRISSARYGLGASIFGADLEGRHRELLQALEANHGNVYRNVYMFDSELGFDPLRTPWGGYRNSRYMLVSARHEDHPALVTVETGPSFTFIDFSCPAGMEELRIPGSREAAPR